MSDLVERLRTASSLAQALPACREAASRIEQLEERMRGTAALFVLWETRATRAEARIKQLEAALREIGEAVLAEREACAAIAAKRPHHSGLEIAELILDQGPPPARQENDDVSKGFRGNNEA
jgi:hypothetical protein